MNYKIIINIPGEKIPSEVLITGEQMDLLENSLNDKRIVKIGDSFFNTTYIAKIVPDVEANMIESPNYMQIEASSESTTIKTNQEELEKLRNKLFKK